MIFNYCPAAANCWDMESVPCWVNINGNLSLWGRGGGGGGGSCRAALRPRLIADLAYVAAIWVALEGSTGTMYVVLLIFHSTD